MLESTPEGVSAVEQVGEVVERGMVNETVAYEIRRKGAHVGAEPVGKPGTGCDGCDPGATQVWGARITTIGVGEEFTLTLSAVCDTTIECLFVPTGQAPNFMVSKIKYRNIDMVIGNQASVTTSGTAVVAQKGVPLSEFLAFGTCANLLRGICLRATIPMEVELTNITNAFTELQVGVKAVSN